MINYIQIILHLRFLPLSCAFDGCYWCVQLNIIYGAELYNETIKFFINLLINLYLYFFN